MPLRLWTKDDWEDRQKLRQAFVDHHAHIRDIVPKDNLLEWVPQDGYRPMCDFLGKPVPNEPFPHINTGNNAAEMHKVLVYIRVPAVLGPYLLWPFATVAAVIIAWYYVL